MATKEIKIKIHDESEHFSPLDPDQNMLSEDVNSYLARVFLNEHRRLREDFVIRIISDTPVDEDHVRNAVHEEFGRLKEDFRCSLKRMMLKMICLAVLGAILLFVWVYCASVTEGVGVEIISIMGWVCIWEATSIFVMQRPELMRMWLNIDKLLKSEMRIETADNNEK